jgi:tetratricopeptide (TPR) repeat protein
MERFGTMSAIFIYLLAGLLYPQDRGGNDGRIDRIGRPKEKPSVPSVVENPPEAPVRGNRLEEPEREPKNICGDVVIPPQRTIVYTSYKEDGIAHLENGNYYEAIAIFSQVLEKNPKDLDLYFLLGSAELKYGMYDEAIKHFTYYLKFFDDDAEAWFRRGLAFLFFGERESARKDFDTADKSGHLKARNYKLKIEN